MQSINELLVAPHTGGTLGPWIRRIDTLIRILCAGVLTLSLMAMFLPTLANAVLRYTTSTSLGWSVEVVQFSFPWFIMAGVVLAAQHARHVNVVALIGLVPTAISRYLYIFIDLLVLISGLVIIYVYLGFGMFEGGMGFAAGDAYFTSLGVPQSFSYLAILVGYILIAMTSITTIYRRLLPGNQ